MREAVIVSTARTPIGKAYRGAFNNTQAQALGGHAIREAVTRAGLEGGEVDDVIMGAALQQGSQGMNIGRQAALRAGLPVSVSGQSIDRQCSSGLMAIATAAKQIIVDGQQIAVGGGVESISLVQNEHQNVHRMVDPELRAMVPGIYTAMIETAEVVAERYGISREAQDEYALQSQQRVAQAQDEGRFDPEIVPLTTTKILVNKETGETTEEEVTLTKDEGNRPTTTIEDLQKLAPVWRGGQFAPEGKYVTAGNASQLSDGAAAVVLMEAKEAEQRGLEPLGAYRGMAVGGCAPEEMGIGPVFAVPKLLEQAGLSVDDIGIWELNEAFASQLLYCRDTLGIPNELLNVSGGAISVGHPYGMTGARCTGHVLLEGKRRNAKYGVVTMCIGGGQGAAGLIEIY
jgi:acetyl-CoA C-acetyltransferase